jgi:hypothetical protein
MTTETRSPRLYRQEDGAMAVDLKTLLQNLASLAAEGEPLRVIVDYRDSRAELLVGPAAAPAPTPVPTPLQSGKLTPTQRSILKTVAKMDVNNPTAREISKAGRLPFDPHLRRLLSALRSEGLLGGAKGEAGYVLTEKGRIKLVEILSGVDPAAFVLTPFQQDILDALDGKALRTDALGHAVGDRSRLFRRPGGIHELRERGFVHHHHRLGFYRPDAPPPELCPARTD